MLGNCRADIGSDVYVLKERGVFVAMLSLFALALVVVRHRHDRLSVHRIGLALLHNFLPLLPGHFTPQFLSFNFKRKTVLFGNIVKEGVIDKLLVDPLLFWIILVR